MDLGVGCVCQLLGFQRDGERPVGIRHHHPQLVVKEPRPLDVTVKCPGAPGALLFDDAASRHLPQVLVDEQVLEVTARADRKVIQAFAYVPQRGITTDVLRYVQRDVLTATQVQANPSSLGINELVLTESREPILHRGEHSIRPSNLWPQVRVHLDVAQPQDDRCLGRQHICVGCLQSELRLGTEDQQTFVHRQNPVQVNAALTAGSQINRVRVQHSCCRAVEEVEHVVNFTGHH